MLTGTGAKPAWVLPNQKHRVLHGSSKIGRGRDTAVGGSSLGAEESSELPADGKEQRNTEPHELPEGVHFPGGFIWLQSFSY